LCREGTRPLLWATPNYGETLATACDPTPNSVFFPHLSAPCSQEREDTCPAAHYQAIRVAMKVVFHELGLAA